ncbi:putative mediator of RNA polymerase II transcription subunit 14-like [Capsicum annuum]|nr:putative mediator of RNA polymerase II transcription subunit 14-like [Capsicum annuum]
MAAITLSLTLAAKPVSSSSPSPSTKAPSLCSSSSLFFNTDKPLFLGPLTTTRKVSRNSKRGFSCYSLFGLGVPELAVIAGVAALVFGPKQLPEVGRTIGKTVKSFQQNSELKSFDRNPKMFILIGSANVLVMKQGESSHSPFLSLNGLFYGVSDMAKEFETELKKEPDAPAQPPVDKAIEGSQEEEQDAKVSSTKESS